MKKRKTYEVSVINKTHSKTYSDQTKFYTSDTALELNFQLKEVEYDFDSAEIILLNVDDRSLATRPVSKSALGFTYELEDDITARFGEWKGQLKFNEGGEIYVSSPVSFRIENDLNNERPPQLTDIRDWESLRQSAKDLIAEMGNVVANESARIEAEKQRVKGYQEMRNIVDNFEIGENAIATENIANGAVIPSKTSFGVEIETLKDFIAEKAITFKNIINNGDFSQGVLGGWASTYATHTAANNTLTNTASGDNVAAYEFQALNSFNEIDTTHKYYFEARLKVTNEFADYIAIALNYTNDAVVMINKPEKDKDYILKGVFNPTRDIVSFRMFHKYASPEVAKGKSMEIKDVIGIDLTETFGYGNEPTAPNVDTILSNRTNRYFDNVIQIFKDESPDTIELAGTTNQISIRETGGKHVISIPNNPTLMRPEVMNTTYGDDIAPEISEWTGVGNAVFSNGAWTVQPKGQLKTTLPVEANAEYEVEIKWTDTNNYGVLDIPRLVVKFGETTLHGQFTGYSDAGYKFVVKAANAGNTELTLGDGVEDWYAVITDVIIRKVISKATPSGKLGIGAFEVLTVGDSIAIGGGLKERTSGNYNTSFGYDALRDTTVGTYNTAIGARALQQNTTGYHNIGIGFQAMQEMKSGYYNTGVGYSVMRHITTGNWNVAMGNEAMRNISSGIRNTSIGSRSMNDLSTGSFNTALGREAGMYPNEKGYTTKTGDNNVFLGYRTGQSHNEETDESTAVGSYATARTRATALGRKALAGGVGSVAIGTDSTGAGAEAQNENEFVLGTENHEVNVKGRFNIKRFTPSGSSDPQGNVGDITSDDNYFYAKTTTGWKRSSLETW